MSTFLFDPISPIYDNKDYKIILLTLTVALRIDLIFHVSSHFLVHISSHFLQSTLYCLCFISFPSVHTSLIMFHFYFLQSTVHLIHFIYYVPSRSHLPYLVVFILHGHSTSLSVSLQPIPSLEINDLRVSLDNFLILDRYSLLEAELRWFDYSLSLYIKQEIQH